MQNSRPVSYMTRQIKKSVAQRLYVRFLFECIPTTFGSHRIVEEIIKQTSALASLTIAHPLKPVAAACVTSKNRNALSRSRRPPVDASVNGSRGASITGADGEDAILRLPAAAVWNTTEGSSIRRSVLLYACSLVLCCITLFMYEPGGPPPSDPSC